MGTLKAFFSPMQGKEAKFDSIEKQLRDLDPQVLRARAIKAEKEAQELANRNSVGRPKKPRVLVDNTDAVTATGLVPAKAPKRTRIYWFANSFVIYLMMQVKSSRTYRSAVERLRKFNPLFDRLGESTVRGWYKPVLHTRRLEA